MLESCSEMSCEKVRCKSIILLAYILCFMLSRRVYKIILVLIKTPPDAFTVVNQAIIC